MGVAGAINPTGGAPRPDPERVAVIRYTIVDEPETFAAFGESARATLASLNERGLAETRSGDLGECRLLLDHIRDRIDGLDPGRLEPRRGLAGLFDSRGRRLRDFRAAYLSAASAVGQSAADIGDRARALGRKEAALETLWSETRDAIAEADAQIAAGRSWLAGQPVFSRVEPETSVLEEHPVESQADAEAAEALPEAGDASASAVIAALPHPLEARVALLEAERAVAIGRLPLMRAAQNADCRAPVALRGVCDGVEGWRADWRDALGLAAKKPRKVRPDRVRLTEAAMALTTRLHAAIGELSAAQARRAELDGRGATLPPPPWRPDPGHSPALASVQATMRAFRSRVAAS